MSSATVRVSISVISGSLALCFNTLLAGIILATKCSFIGNYKYLLFLYTVTSAMYSIGQITTAASFIIFPDGYVMYDTVRVLPVTIGCIFINLYIATFIQNVVILTHSFTYRYLVICNPQGLEIFIGNWVKIAIGSITVITLVLGPIAYSFKPSPMSEELFGEGFYRATGHSLANTAYNGGITFYHGLFNWSLFIGLGSFTVLIFVSTCIIVTAALRTAKKLKIIATESQAMHSQQKKIFTLLIFQISLPLVSNMFPIQFVLTSTYFQLPTQFLIDNIGCILTVAQVIDPLLIFYFIKPYRRALWGKIFQARVSSAGNSHTDQQHRTSHSNATSPF